MVHWDDAAEKQMLLSIIHGLQPVQSSIAWTDVAKAVGQGCTEEACKQKLKKLRAAAKTQFGEPPTGGAGEMMPKTPVKRAGKRAAGDTPIKTIAGKRKAQKGKDGEAGAEAEANSKEPAEDESPTTKKLKTGDGGDGED